MIAFIKFLYHNDIMQNSRIFNHVTLIHTISLLKTGNPWSHIVSICNTKDINLWVACSSTLLPPHSQSL